jgi:proteasome lid subunit RPN8/RPN11
MVNHIKQHLPKYVDGIDKAESDFNTTEDLLELDWVKRYKDSDPTFYMWGISKELLMATYNVGKSWRTVGYISRPELVQLPRIISFNLNKGNHQAIFEEIDDSVKVEEEKTEEGFLEEVWFLFGFRIHNLFFGFTVYQNKGEVAHVTFDWKKAFSFLPFLKDANKFLLGFYHTHPGGDPSPSTTDTETMGTWVKALGKRTLCGIKSGNVQKCYLYQRVSDKSPDIKYKKIKSVWINNFFYGRYHEGR